MTLPVTACGLPPNLRLAPLRRRATSHPVVEAVRETCGCRTATQGPSLRRLAVPASFDAQSCTQIASRGWSMRSARPRWLRLGEPTGPSRDSGSGSFRRPSMPMDSGLDGRTSGHEDFAGDALRTLVQRKLQPEVPRETGGVLPPALGIPQRAAPVTSKGREVFGLGGDVVWKRCPGNASCSITCTKEQAFT